MKTAVLTISIFFLMAGSTSGGQGKGQQRIFDSETGTVQSPMALPPNVLKVLSADSDVMNIANGRQGAIPKEWFSASVIPTARSAEKMYLVEGNGPLVGAHATTFWVVACSRPGAQPAVLLKVVADRLELGSADSSGYPKVTVSRITAASSGDVVYHYLTGKYVSTPKR